MVAEDETLIRMDLFEMLTEAGYEVIAQASNGEEAINLANLHKPDLAIVGCQDAGIRWNLRR